jgi:hypothetical protein
MHRGRDELQSSHHPDDDANDENGSDNAATNVHASLHWIIRFIIGTWERPPSRRGIEHSCTSAPLTPRGPRRPRRSLIPLSAPIRLCAFAPPCDLLHQRTGAHVRSVDRPSDDQGFRPATRASNCDGWCSMCRTSSCLALAGPVINTAPAVPIASTTERKNF